MPNENSSEQQAQNAAENDNSENEQSQSSENTEEGSQGGDGAKQEESVYAKNLREIEDREKAALERAEAAEKKLEDEKAVNERKEKTIQSLKKKAPEDQSDLEERIIKRVRSEQETEKVAQMVKGLSTDPDEQKLILKHYNSSIVKTGDLSSDLRNAAAIANSHVVFERKRIEAEESGRQELLASLPSFTQRGEQPLSYKDPIHAAAEKLVQNINPNAVKELDKYFRR